MTLTQLRYALAVDSFRHFGKAAEYCHVSQPTLSMQLRKLEEELGVMLFDRGSQPVEPTDAGRQILAQARVAVREAERITEVVNLIRDTIRGDFILGILPTIAPYLLPLIAQPFKQRHPEVRLVVRELRTEEILDELHRGTLDAGIIATDPRQPGIAEIPLFDEPFAAYLAENHPQLDVSPLIPERIAAENFWLLNDGHCFREQVLEACGSRRFSDSSLMFESGTLDTLQKMVEWHGGATLLPALATLYIDDLRTGKHLRSITTPVPMRRVRLVHMRSPLKHRHIRLLRDTILESLPDGLVMQVHP